MRDEGESFAAIAKHLDRTVVATRDGLFRHTGTTKGRPRLTPGGYWDGPPIDREATEKRREEYDIHGSAMLRERLAEQILRHADTKRTSVAQAMNELLYAGELR